ncbi:MAG: HAMP domain-containing histidine kinase, partial [Clostridia bacterium]|nr:HAMP domain-containing histidine kinase [Clostridia bacterium]
GEFDRRVTVYGNDEVAELSDAFNKMADSLAKNEQIRSEFIANISHELKTPMTTIAGFADGMLDGTIPPERREEYLQTIGSETRRLSRLVNKLLLTSRIDAGRQEIHPTRINICDIIGRCAIGLEKQIEEKGLDVELDFADDRVFVQADPDAVMQIMYNLIDNAQKYTDPGGKLRVSVAKKSGLCEISVYNTGCGIPLEDLPHVFDRFYKVDKSRGLAKDSFGLGLYIVRTLVNRHGQEIYARSSPGEYAEFTFALKLDKQKNDPETVARLAEHEEDTRLQ